MSSVEICGGPVFSMDFWALGQNNELFFLFPFFSMRRAKSIVSGPIMVLWVVQINRYFAINLNKSDKSYLNGILSLEQPVFNAVNNIIS